MILSHNSITVYTTFTIFNLQARDESKSVSGTVGKQVFSY